MCCLGPFATAVCDRQQLDMLPWLGVQPPALQGQTGGPVAVKVSAAVHVHKALMYSAGT